MGTETFNGPDPVPEPVVAGPEVRVEIRAYPVPFKSDFELEIPRVLQWLGLDARGKAPQQLHVVAMVDVDAPSTRYGLRLCQEGIPAGKLDFQLGRPIGHAVLDKPRRAYYWLFPRP